MWAQNLLRKARKEGLIQNDWFAHVLIKEVLYKNEFLESFIFPNIADIPLQVDNMANMNGMLICYGWINIPLVYTQVRKASIVRRASSPSGRHAGGVRILRGLPLWSPGEPSIYIYNTDSTVSVPPAHPIQSRGKLLCASKDIGFLLLLTSRILFQGCPFSNHSQLDWNPGARSRQCHRLRQ